MTDGRQRADTIIGWAVYGAVTTGVFGILGALVAAFRGEFVSAGIFLVAAGIAFGLLSGAVLRQ